MKEFVFDMKSKFELKLLLIKMCIFLIFCELFAHKQALKCKNPREKFEKNQEGNFIDCLSPKLSYNFCDKIAES